MSQISFTPRTIKRIQADISEIQKENNPFIKIVSDLSRIDKIDVCITGPEDSVYQNESFILRFVFPQNYPFTNPIVQFVPPRVPQHEHVYSNGHICLSIIYAPHWMPTMSIMSVCLSIISMLASAKKKSRPPGDLTYCSRAPRDPRQSRWVFEDDKC